MGSRAYRFLRKAGLRITSGSYLAPTRKNAIKQMPKVHAVFSLLRRWLLGLSGRGSSDFHCSRISTNSFFPLQRRHSANRWLSFSACWSAPSPPATYATLGVRPRYPWWLPERSGISRLSRQAQIPWHSAAHGWTAARS